MSIIAPAINLEIAARYLGKFPLLVCFAWENVFLTGWLGEVKSWLAMRMFGVWSVFSPRWGFGDDCRKNGSIKIQIKVISFVCGVK